MLFASRRSVNGLSGCPDVPSFFEVFIEAVDIAAIQSTLMADNERECAAGIRSSVSDGRPGAGSLSQGLQHGGPMTVGDVFNQAFDHFEAGRFRDAESACRLILQSAPDEHRVIRLLGAVCFRNDRLAEGEQHFRRAIELAPDVIEYRDNLCSVLTGLRRWSDVEDEARGLISFAPQDPRGHNRLGCSLKETGRHDQAEEALRVALTLAPNSIQIHNNLANVVRLAGRPAESEQLCRTAIAIAPIEPVSHLNLGAALHSQQRFESAVAAFDHALVLRPDLAEAAFNRGASLELLDRFTEAEASYRLALELQPDMLTALNNLGVVLKLQGRLEEAMACFRQALEQDVAYMIARTNLLTAMQCAPEFGPEEVTEAHREWDLRHAADVRREMCEPIHAASSDASRNRLRVGFVSPDFGIHPVGRFLIPVFEKLDPKRIETFCYSDRVVSDAITDRFRSAASVWRETRFLTDTRLAEMIQADGIDVLIDLAGHTGHHRLLVFARRPAPVQATWIGYPGTTGLQEMDRIIADPFLIPAGSESHYTEQVARLPNCHICVAPDDSVPDIINAPLLRNGFVTFGSFNKLDKTTDEVIRTWSRILKAVPDSRLVLRNRGLSDSVVAARLMRLFAENSIAAERISLHGWTSHAELLERWSEVDIGLDTFPFSGGSTSIDALWMGVPVITLVGKTFASRQTGAFLNVVGHAELITDSQESYVKTAVELASSTQRIVELRGSLREKLRTSPLCDAAGLADSLADLLSEIRHTSGNQIDE